MFGSCQTILLIPLGDLKSVMVIRHSYTQRLAMTITGIMVTPLILLRLNKPDHIPQLLQMRTDVLAKQIRYQSL